MGRHSNRRLAAALFAAGALAGGCESGPCAELACREGTRCVEIGEGAEATAECRCGSETGPACGLEDTCMADAQVCVPAAVCGAGTRWTPGQPAFRDATADWGLDALGVQGVRLSVTDIDGDGWADLEVRRGRLGPEDFSGDASAQIGRAHV
jgi:enediyne biosynthesis protein E4